MEGLREDANKERFIGVEKTLRDIQRGVQLIRDKQARSSASDIVIEERHLQEAD